MPETKYKWSTQGITWTFTRDYLRQLKREGRIDELQFLIDMVRLEDHDELVDYFSKLGGKKKGATEAVPSSVR